MTNNIRRVKQVIVWRKDIKCRVGKKMSQVAHASLGPIFQMMQRHDWNDGTSNVEYTIYTHDASPLVMWKEGRFTKIVVGVENEQQLLELHAKVQATAIPCSLICDAGLTEFNGVPTNTCLGIGPWWADEIDHFTGDLSLM